MNRVTVQKVDKRNKEYRDGLKTLSHAEKPKNEEGITQAQVLLIQDTLEQKGFLCGKDFGWYYNDKDGWTTAMFWICPIPGIKLERLAYKLPAYKIETKVG